MNQERIRPFSREYWLERQRQFAFVQDRKRRYWMLIVGLAVALFCVAMISVSITGGLPEDEESIIMTGE